MMIVVFPLHFESHIQRIRQFVSLLELNLIAPAFITQMERNNEVRKRIFFVFY